MSLIRQLWLGVICMALAALTGSFIISVWSARGYLQQQLYLKNQDNAANLALLLSQQPYDPLSVELFIAAQFDTGHYALIRFTDPRGKILVERRQHADTPEIPRWFQHSIPLTAQAGQAAVHQGWRQSGTITVESHTRFAYQSLWQGCVDLLLWFLLGALLTGGLGSLWLRRIRKPLDSVVYQARAIQERRFVTMREPDIYEFKTVSRAMNEAVLRLQAMFQEEAARLDALQQEANRDALTGLMNRSCFMAELEQALHAPKAASHGVLIMLRINHLAEINRRVGRMETDRLLKSLAKGLSQLHSAESAVYLGRINGSDFALLHKEAGDGQALAQAVYETSQSVQANWPFEPILFACAWGEYRAGQPTHDLLAAVDSALARAETLAIPIAGIATHHAQGPRPPQTILEWQHLFDRVVRDRQFKLEHYPVVDNHGVCLHREAVLRMSPEADHWWSAASFMPMACRLRRSAELDFIALELAMQHLAQTSEAYSVNIDGTSLAAPGFISRVETLLRQHNAELSRLWLEVSEISALNHPQAFTEWCTRLSPLGVRLGVEHFGDRLSAISNLSSLGLAYLKVDGHFIHGLQDRPANQNFIKGVIAMGHSIGALVIAEGIQSDTDWQISQTLGFDAATGPAIKP